MLRRSNRLTRPRKEGSHRRKYRPQSDVFVLLPLMLALTNHLPSSSLNSLPMKLRILYHGNCFDGVSSAAVFSKFYKTKLHPDAEIEYTPTMHRAGNAFDREQFDGDENAIV